jgi:transposase
MQVRYRFRIEPTPAQQRMLARVFGCCRVVFNDALRVRDEAYQAGVKLSNSEIGRRVITQAKKTTERRWLAEVPSVALVQSVNDSRRAWRNFFDSRTGKRKGRKLGRPKMKSKKDHRQSFRLTRNGFSIRPNARLFVAKVGQVRVRWSRELPSEPSSVTIIREPAGCYYASFVVDVAATPLPVLDREAGLDVGISRLATVATSDGVSKDIENPEHLGRKLRKLRRLEREKSRSSETIRIVQQGQDAAQARHRARESGACPAGLSPQAGFSVGSRQPSDPRRRPQHRGHGRQSSARSGINSTSYLCRCANGSTRRAGQSTTATTTPPRSFSPPGGRREQTPRTKVGGTAKAVPVEPR